MLHLYNIYRFQCLQRSSLPSCMPEALPEIGLLHLYRKLFEYHLQSDQKVWHYLQKKDE